MRHLFTLFMLVALVMGQGTSLATSICQHGSLQAHVAARQSHDPRKAAVAYAEETGDAAAAKKGTASDAGSGPLLAALLPPSPTTILFPRERMLLRPSDQPPLVGVSLRPPLPPPLA